MLTKNELKYYSSLLLKKNRQKERKFLVEGLKLIQEALNSGFKCDVIFFTKAFFDENVSVLEQHIFRSIRTESLKPADFIKLTDTKTPQEIAAVFYFQENTSGSELPGRIICALENISDPGNMGTILRNCDWFGVKQVILNENCAEIYNPKVIRASAGSVFHLNIAEHKDLYGFLEQKKKSGCKILCADLDGKNLYDYHTTGKEIIVLANEANGPSEKLLDMCDSKITIPRLGKAESLNVASASAVLLAELTKQRG